jgi:hypothetical protein
MARTYRTSRNGSAYRDGRNVCHHREEKAVRKATNRAVRHVVRVAIAVGDTDVLPGAPRTGGFYTW